MYLLPVALLGIQCVCMYFYKLEDGIEDMKAANLARREKMAAAE